jgi:hypothetical protein
MTLAAVLTPPDKPGVKQEGHWFFGVAACWMLVFLPMFLILHLGAVRPTGGGSRYLILSGAHPRFVEALEDDLDYE